ncbi:hypothetical protein Tco_0855241, partial [Tanacetum coccineum]
DNPHKNKDLGLQVKQKPDGIFISQDKYVQDMLKKFDMESVRTATTPYEASKPKSKDEPDDAVNVHLYRSMIGSLMYLTASRPDIMFAVSACSRHQVTPLTSNLNAVKKIFKYLKGQPKLGLWYPRDSPFVLEAYSDSDYAGSNGDRKSITGGCQFLAANCCGQFWSTASLRAPELGPPAILATIDRTPYTITEDTVRSQLQLGDDGGIEDLPIADIYLGMDNLGYPTEGKLTFHKNKFSPQWRFLVHTIQHCLSSKSGSWDQFGSPLAIALICLSDERRFNWSSYIFKGMVNNISNAKRFLMYPRFLQIILGIETRNTKQYHVLKLSSKLFANMRLNFEGDHMPLLAAMLSPAQAAIADEGTGEAAPDVPHTISETIQETRPEPDQSQEQIPTPRRPTTSDHIPPVFEQGHTLDPNIASFSGANESDPDLFTSTNVEEETLGGSFHTTPPSLIKKRKKSRIWILSSNWLRLLLLQILIVGCSPGDDIPPNPPLPTDMSAGVSSGVSTGAPTGPSTVSPGSTTVPTSSSVPAAETIPASSGTTPETPSSPVRDARKGKGVAADEPTPTHDKTFKQLEEERLGWEAAQRLQAQELADFEKQRAESLMKDANLARQMSQDFEMTEDQRKRQQEVLASAANYSDAAWDIILARLQANPDLSSTIFGVEFTDDDFAAKMVKVGSNTRRKELAEQRAKERRERPMTPSQLRQYMRTYVKNQGPAVYSTGWTMAQVRKLSPEQLQEENQDWWGDDEVNVEAPSHGVPQEEEGATPSQNVSREEVAAPSHSQDIPDAPVEVPSNIASTSQHTASSLKKVGTKKKRLGRKVVHTFSIYIPIEEEILKLTQIVLNMLLTCGFWL